MFVTMNKFLLFSGTLLIIFSNATFAQKGVEDGSKYGHGPDSIKCVTNLSLYREYSRQRDFKMAYPFWRLVFNECPQSSKNIYIDGVKMIKQFIEKEKNPEVSKKLIDTLMMVYDQRIKYYPADKGDQLERKAVDLLRYRRDDIKYVEEAYGYLKESIKIEKNKSGEAGLATFVTTSISLYQNNKLDLSTMIDNYILVNEIMISKITANPKDTNLTNLKSALDANFIAIPMTCDDIVPKLRSIFEKDKYNIENLKLVTSALKTKGCSDNDLFYEASIIFHDTFPSAESAANIGQMAFAKGNYQESADYFKQSTSLETNSVTNAAYYFGLANALYKLDRLPEARESALKAANLRGNWGEPYILIGRMYAESTDKCSGLTLPRAIYWAAVDKFLKAKSIDPMVEETANKLILTYSAYFPPKEDAFFLNISEGDSYSLGCWINETTRARF